MAPERKSIREHISFRERTVTIEPYGPARELIAELRVTARYGFDDTPPLPPDPPSGSELLERAKHSLTRNILDVIYGDARTALHECEEAVCQALHSYVSMSPSAAMKVLANFGKVHRLLEGRHPVTEESSDE